MGLHQYLNESPHIASVKNTFVHLDKPPTEDKDCDLELPHRAVSAPSISTLSGTCSPATECLESLQSWTPASTREDSPSFSLEALESEEDVIVPRLLCSTSLFLGLPGTHGMPPQSRSSSSMGSSCSFTVKNTFVHDIVDADVDGDDDLGLPACRRRRRIVSQPELTLLQAASFTSAPAAPTIPSVGSALHSTGQCKPCAWFWKDAGCEWGAECRHCHLCPRGELQCRKKEGQAKARKFKRDVIKRAASFP